MDPKTITGVIAAGLVSLSAGVAAAEPIRWTLSATTSDEGTVSGTFVYDADTDTYSAVDLTASTGERYIAGYTGHEGEFGVFRSDATPSTSASAYAVRFNPALSNARAPATASTGGKGLCGDAACSSVAATVTNTGGTVTADPAAVPTLSEWAMIMLTAILAGGALLTLSRRRCAA